MEITEPVNNMISYVAAEPRYDDILVIANNIKGTNGSEFKINFQLGNNTPKYLTQSNAISSSNARSHRQEIVRLNKDTYRYVKGGYITGQATDIFDVEGSIEDKIKIVNIYVKTGDTVNQGTVKLLGKVRSDLR